MSVGVYPSYYTWFVSLKLSIKQTVLYSVEIQSTPSSEQIVTISLKKKCDLFLHVELTTFHSVILLNKGLLSNIKVVFNTTVCNTGTINTIYMGFYVALYIGSAYPSFSSIRTGLIHGMSTGFSRSSLNSQCFYTSLHFLSFTDLKARTRSLVSCWCLSTSRCELWPMVGSLPIGIIGLLHTKRYASQWHNWFLPFWGGCLYLYGKRFTNACCPLAEGRKVWPSLHAKTKTILHVLKQDSYCAVNYLWLPSNLNWYGYESLLLLLQMTKQMYPRLGCNHILVWKSVRIERVRWTVCKWSRNKWLGL